MKPGRLIVIDRTDTRSAAALVVNNRIEDLLVDHPDPTTPVPGTVFRARVERKLTGLGGFILNLGQGQHGFMKSSVKLKPGHHLAVQVKTIPAHGKAAGVAPQIRIRTRYVVLEQGHRGIEFSERLSEDQKCRIPLQDVADSIPGLDLTSTSVSFRAPCLDADLSTVADELTRETCEFNRILESAARGNPGLRARAPAASDCAMTEWMFPTPDRIIDERGSFDTLGIWDMVARILDPAVSLPKSPGAPERVGAGATMVIEPTQALVAVDVNTGDIFSRSPGLDANLLAIEDLPRQLRLRGLGGQVVIDLAPMAKRHRNQIKEAIANAFSSDPVTTTPVGWTPLGHFELHRKRERFSLDALEIEELMKDTCA